MMESLLAQQVAKKADLLKEAERAYYNGEPIMTDERYDRHLDHYNKLVNRLAEEQNRSAEEFMRPVGANPESGLAKVQHVIPMLSLDKANDESDVSKWLRRHKIHETVLTAEPKVDGASLRILYENGKFKQAGTRGNGYVGEDVTEQAKRLNGLPLTIPSRAKWKSAVKCTSHVANLNVTRKSSVIRATWLLGQSGTPN